MLKGNERYRWQILLLRLMIVGVVLVLTVRLYSLQIVQGSRYRVLADRNRLRTVAVPAPRGVIYDRGGDILARNVPSFAVAIVPADLPKTETGEADLEGQEVVLDRLMELLMRPMPSPTPRPTPSPMPTPTAKPGEVAPTATPVLQIPSPLATIPQRQPWVMERKDIEQAIAGGLLGGAYRPVVVAKYIDQSTAFLVAEAAPNLPGVELTLVPIRDYLTGALTSHALGYMGSITEEQLSDYEAKGYQQTEQVGLTGLEKSFEEELHGKPGRETIEVDVNGRRVRTIGQVDAPQPGHNLVLTIDLKLQKVATAALQEALSKSTGFFKATEGAVVALNPRNGAVLAMVSLPSFDNNWFAKGITPEAWDALNKDPNLPMLNKTIQGSYPPGSTFKMIPASGGLQEGLINSKTLLGEGFPDASGGIMYLQNKYGGPPTAFYCWIRNYGGGHGLINVRQALAESCDIFFYQLGGGFREITPGLGLTTLDYYAMQFGLGEPSGIALEGEASGLVPDEKYKRLHYADQWTTGDTYNMSIGQGFVLATPLQIANMTAAVANRGTLYTPQLVDHVLDADGNLVRGFEPSVIRQVAVDPANLDIVREGMYGAVNWPQGTAPSVRLPNIAVAGKTGSAEFFRDNDKDGQPDKDAHGNLPTHAWFTSFAPYADPEIVVTVFIANGGEGSQIAAPVAAKVLRAYFNVPESSGYVAPTGIGD